MLCKQARRQIDDIAQPAQASLQLRQHIEDCDACAKLFEERAALHHAFAHLRAETAALGPSDCVEERVLETLRASAPRPRSTTPPLRWAIVGALALATLVASLMLTSGRTHPVQPIITEEPFTAMPYVVPAGQHERTIIVRTRISSQIVQNAGLEVQDDAESSALADVVLGDGGRLLALRLVSRAHPTSEKRIN